MDRMASPKTVVIVGAGFCGAATAVHLLGMLRTPTRVVLIGTEVSFGRGVAYSTPSVHHLLNVPAGRMSLYPDEPESFSRYLASQALPYGSMDFAPRHLFGRYLEWCLTRAQQNTHPEVSLEKVMGQVVDIQRVACVGGAAERKILLADGRSFSAEHVVLATGHLPLRKSLDGRGTVMAGVHFANPWDTAASRGLAPDESVLLLGSGLTAVDIALQLINEGHAGGIVMLSRRGQLPQAHRHHDTQPPSDWIEAGFCAGESSVLVLLREVRRRIRLAEAVGADWRDVIGSLRAHTPRLWEQLSPASRRQFLRHLSVFWEAHRHRASPEVAASLSLAVKQGRMEIIAGRLVKFDASATSNVDVSIRPRGATVTLRRRFSKIINCTGPSSGATEGDDSLLLRLDAAGEIKCDALRLGLEMGDRYEVQQRSGETNRALYYVGPFLRAQYWEATAVPELRIHARDLARQIAACFEPPATEPSA
jgi:uncharacterized NAD(P)/FAD-binding protein YdhS